MESNMKNKLILIASMPIVLAACAAPGNRPDLQGSSAPPSSAWRTVVINPDTRHVNVDGGEVVRFVANGKEFTWDFSLAPTTASVALDRVAPAGMLDHEVRAYVAPDPRYIMGGGERLY
jgi:hypothetical protein